MPTIEVSPLVMNEISRKLTRAKHLSAFAGDGVINLNGVSLVIEKIPAVEESIEFTSILSASTHEGRVELRINEFATQWPINKARHIAHMLLEAIEAAASDQMLWTFLTKNCELSEAAAGAALLDLREVRQGSKDVVYPQ